MATTRSAAKVDALEKTLMEMQGNINSLTKTMAAITESQAKMIESQARMEQWVFGKKGKTGDVEKRSMGSNIKQMEGKYEPPLGPILKEPNEHFAKDEETSLVKEQLKGSDCKGVTNGDKVYGRLNGLILGELQHSWC